MYKFITKMKKPARKLSFCLSVCLSVYLSVCLSVCLYYYFTYQSTPRTTTLYHPPSRCILHFFLSCSPFSSLVLPCHVVWCGFILCCGSCFSTSLSYLLLSLPFPSLLFHLPVCVLGEEVT